MSNNHEWRGSLCMPGSVGRSTTEPIPPAPIAPILPRRDPTALFKSTGSTIKSRPITDSTKAPLPSLQGYRDMSPIDRKRTVEAYKNSLKTKRDV
jgi:hypothetical protein